MISRTFGSVNRQQVSVAFAVLAFAVVGILVLALLPSRSLAHGDAHLAAASTNYLGKSTALPAVRPDGTANAWAKDDQVVFKYSLEQNSGEPASIVWTSNAELSVALEAGTATTTGWPSNCGDQKDNQETCLLRNVPSGKPVTLEIKGKLAITPTTSAPVLHKVAVVLVGDTLASDTRFETKELTTKLPKSAGLQGHGCLTSCGNI